jgi:hypothetical protein
MNKWLLLVLCFYLQIVLCRAQEPSSSTIEQQLESNTEVQNAETGNDYYQQQLFYFKKHPININTAKPDDLRELQLLTDLQIDNLITYRQLLGNLKNKYELQAIPGWHNTLIEQILPYIQVTENLGYKQLQNNAQLGNHSFLIRYAQVLEKAKGYLPSTSNSSTPYRGSPEKLLLRYQYRYQRKLQWGFLAEKDAGEPAFNAQQRGLDFYSFHLFTTTPGLLKALAIGDFTVNMGQGLLQWQSLAFKKGADVISVKRQSALLRPYNSVGENNFQRGLGITLQHKHWEATAFGSFKYIDANVEKDTNSHSSFISSFLTSGYHRTLAELADKHTVQQLTYGGNLQFKRTNAHIGFNFITHQFSVPIQKNKEPYNLFALSGNSFSNASIDYGYTFNNAHFFGEIASNEKGAKALVAGMLLSMNAHADASLVYRSIAPNYTAINANAFTENSNPINENGLYMGLALRPMKVLKINGYVDVFQFPWLKFRIDKPSTGSGYFLQATYLPYKQLELYARYATESKSVNIAADTARNRLINIANRQVIRFHINYQYSHKLLLKHRVEWAWYNNHTLTQEHGFLLYVEQHYTTAKERLAANIRIQYVQANGYNARVYAYENDVRYSYAVPAFAENSFRYYINWQWRFLPSGSHRQRYDATLWLRFGQSLFQNKKTATGNLEDMAGSSKSEIKAQLIIQL